MTLQHMKPNLWVVIIILLRWFKSLFIFQCGYSSLKWQGTSIPTNSLSKHRSNTHLYTHKVIFFPTPFHCQLPIISCRSCHYMRFHCGICDPSSCIHTSSNTPLGCTCILSSSSLDSLIEVLHQNTYWMKDVSEALHQMSLQAPYCTPPGVPGGSAIGCP